MTTSAVVVEPGAGVTGPDRDSVRLWIVRIAVAATSVAASFVALLPAVLFLGDGAMLWPALGIIVLVSGAAVARMRPTHFHRPSVLEVMASFLSALSLGSMTSLVSLGSYVTVEFLHWAASKVAGLFDRTIPFGWEGPAMVFGYFVGGILLPGVVVMTAKGLMQALFPSVAGYSTPFRRWLSKPWVPVLVGAAFMLVVAFVVLAFTWPRNRFGIGASLITSFVMLFTTIWAWAGAQEETAPRKFTTAEDRVGAVLKSLGWSLVPQPRTGQAEIDPFLADIDFLAVRDDRALAVLVTSRGLTEQELVRKAANVALAARALSAAGEKNQAAAKPVEPVLVVLESELSSKLQAFTNHQGVTVVYGPYVDDLDDVDEDDDATTEVLVEDIFDEALREKAISMSSDFQSGEAQFSLAPQSRMR